MPQQGNTQSVFECLQVHPNKDACSHISFYLE